MGATMPSWAGRRDRDQCKSSMALRKSTGGYTAEEDPSLRWLSSTAADLAAFSFLLSRTQQRARPEENLPMPHSLADLEGKDFFNQCVPKDKAGASCGVAQEVLQGKKLHSRTEISIRSFPDISLCLVRGCAPSPTPHFTAHRRMTL